MKTKLLVLFAVCLSFLALIPNVEALREILTVD